MSADPRKILQQRIENEMKKMHSTFGVADGMKSTVMISLFNEMSATIMSQFDRIVELESQISEKKEEKSD